MKKYGLVDFKKGSHKSMKPVLPYKNLKIAHNIINEHDNGLKSNEKKKSQGGSR